MADTGMLVAGKNGVKAGKLSTLNEEIVRKVKQLTL